MVTDLVDQHVADDAVHWLAVSVGVTEVGMRTNPIGQTSRNPTRFSNRQSHAMIQPEQITYGSLICIAFERLRVGEIGHMNRHIAKRRAELLRQTVPDCPSGQFNISLRPRLI